MSIKDIPVLKNIIIELNNNEVLEDIDVINARKAYINARNMELVTTDDFFLFFASINLLNAYVKKDYITNKKYDFKKNIISGIESLIKNSNSDIKFCYNKNLTTIEINGLQFTFHNVEISDVMKEHKYEDIEWLGVRLQPVASTIFEFANSLDNLTKKTFFGEDLDSVYKKSELGVSADNPNVLEIFI